MCWCLILEWVDGNTFNVSFSIIRDKFTTVLCFLYEELKNTKKWKCVTYNVIYTIKHVHSHTHMQCILTAPMSSWVSFLFLLTPLTENAASLSNFCVSLFYLQTTEFNQGQSAHSCMWTCPLEAQAIKFSLLQHPIVSSSPGRGTYHELFLPIVYDWLLVNSIV